MPRFLTLSLLLLLTSATGRAQSHFTFKSGTGNNATLVIAHSASPTLGGAPLEAGDEIAVATPAGLVVGAVVWPGAGGGNVSLTVNGDDEVGTPNVIDGIRAGEALQYRVWDKSANVEYGGATGSVAVTYSSAQAFYRTDGLYAANALYALSSLAVSVPTAPPAPALAAPADGVTGVALAPTLAWNAAAGATGYDVQVASASDFAAPLVSQSGLAGTSTSAGGLANQTRYYWRVRATNGAGVSAWSAPFSFTTVAAAPQAPALTTPADGATGLDAAALALAWNGADGAGGYDVQVATSEAFTATVAGATGLAVTTYAPQGLQTLTRYYWRVRATGAGGTGPWSTSRSFTTAAPQAPQAPSITAPADGATGVPVAPTLGWQATARAERYDVQISTADDFTTLLVDRTGLSGTSTAASGLQNSAAYYWRVRAVNAGGASPWSAPARFTTAALQAPQAPTHVAPADGVSELPSRLPLSWSSVETATSYDVQVSDFGMLAFEAVSVAGTSVEASGLRGRTTFYWRVRARNAAGVGAWSGVRSFTTMGGVAVEQGAAPAATALVGAAPNPVRGRAVVHFTLAAAAAVRLEVIDGLGRTVALLVDGKTLPAGRHAATFEAVGLPAGIYVCRLQAGTVEASKRLVLLGRP